MMPFAANTKTSIVLLVMWIAPRFTLAQDSICVTVKIEIKQQLTHERQAFDAHMRINNGLDTISLEDVSINVNFADEQGQGVRASADSQDSDALFFIRVESMEGISDLRGGGAVKPKSSADIHWLIIPASGAGGKLSSGKLYQVGATLRNTLGGDQKVTKVTPDFIYVKPLPQLRLDYFLTREVYADDAFTQEIESPEPFTLGVRVRNEGAGVARSLRIDSGQPKIAENEQGLLIGFKIIDGAVNGQPASDGLLADFGDIAPRQTAIGRWVMTTSLSGRFVDFSATFSHADELGGELTSLIDGDAIRTHALLHDVLVDLNGGDQLRDFLGKDGDSLRLYESSGFDTEVADQSKHATLQSAGQPGDSTLYTLRAPATAGPFYVKLPDPHNGGKSVIGARRSDGKGLPPENFWLSKTRDENTSWQHFINLFDVNTSGSYTLTFGEHSLEEKAPALQFIADRTTRPGQRQSFVIEASDPNGSVPLLLVAGLPQGARFEDQGKGRGVFDWTPTTNQKGTYPIRFTASDGRLETSHTATITVAGMPVERSPAWVAGDVPAGGEPIGDWNWHESPSISGVRSHAGRPVEGRALHYFIRGTERFSLALEDNLVQYLYLDPELPPKQILLQPYVDGQHEGHSVYWGKNLFDLGGSEPKKLGDLPEPGKWVRLRVPVEQLEIKNGWVNGMLYGHYDGRVYWGPTTKSVGRLDTTPEVIIVTEQ